MADLPRERRSVGGSAARPFFTPAGWFLLAVFCASFLVYGFWATNGRIAGWEDVALISAVVLSGTIALLNGFRSAQRRKRERRLHRDRSEQDLEG